MSTPREADIQRLRVVCKALEELCLGITPSTLLTIHEVQRAAHQADELARELGLTSGPVLIETMGDPIQHTTLVSVKQPWSSGSAWAFTHAWASADAGSRRSAGSSARGSKRPGGAGAHAGSPPVFDGPPGRVVESSCRGDPDAVAGVFARWMAELDAWERQARESAAPGASAAPANPAKRPAGRRKPAPDHDTLVKVLRQMLADHPKATKRWLAGKLARGTKFLSRGPGKLAYQEVMRDAPAAVPRPAEPSRRTHRN